MAQYLDYEGLKTYDKNIKGVIAIKAVKDVTKITKELFPEEAVFQYAGEDTVEEKLKVTVTEFDSDLNLVFITDSDTWNNFVNNMGAGEVFTGTAEDGNKYTIEYSGSSFNVKKQDGTFVSTSGHAEGTTETISVPSLTNGKFYKINYEGDTPKFSLVQLGVDASSVALAYDIESNVEAGAINPGDVIKEGTNFTEFVKKLLTKEIPLTAKLVLAQEAGTLQIGVKAKLTKATVNITKGSASSVDKVMLYIGDSTTGTELTKATDTSYTATFNNEYEEDTVFKAIVTYKKSDAATVASAEAKASYKFINPILTFKIPSANGVTTQLDNIDLADLTGTALTDDLKEFTTYKFPVNVNAGVCGFGVPAGTTVSSIKDNSGFEYFDAFTKLTKEVTDKSGAKVNYDFYVSPKATLTGTFAYTFK